MAGLVPAIHVFGDKTWMPGNDKDNMTPSRIHRLTLTHFRNYRAAGLEAKADMVALVGPNGAGKTNCIEAISFLSPGRGLRRATLDDVADNQGDGSWAVSAQVEGALGLATLGRRGQPALPHRPRTG
jgi:DNA replication and repair protein RecF